MRSWLFLLVAFSALTGRGQDPCNVSLQLTLPTCPGDADGVITVLLDQAGQFTYSWSQDGALNGPIANHLSTGEYTVTVSDTSGCVSVLDTVLPDPYVAPLGTMATTNISCAGNTDGSVTFTVHPGPYTWHWTDDASITSNTRTGLGAGDYTVVVLGGTCPSYVTGSLGDPDVNINDAINDTIKYCPSNPPLITTTLEWGFQPDVYVWSTGATTTSLQVVPGMSGTITVTATDTTIGCVASGEITLTELPHPTVAFTVDDSVCIRSGLTPTILASDADSLVWRWGGSGLSHDSLPNVVFTDPLWQPISLQGFDPLGCGSVPVPDSVYVRSRIPATFTADQLPCTSTIEVWLGSNSDSCAFFIGDSLAFSQCYGWVDLDLQRYQPYDLTFYSTKPDHCDDTTAFHIDVKPEPQLFLPNAFTPNNDGFNDVWPGPTDIPENGYQVEIFDRWGEILWTSTNTHETWDGASVPNGIYGYTMRMQDPCEPKREIAKNGFVALFR